MKYSLLYIFMAFICCSHNNIYADNGPVKLTCIVDSSCTQVPQWVYWFTLHDNEYEIADSCFIERGQKIVHLQCDLKDDYALHWLTFSKAGPKELALTLAPGEDVTIYVKSCSGGFPESKGSVGTKEDYEQTLKIKEIHNNRNRLEASLAIATEDSLQKQIIDSISYYQKEAFTKVYLDCLRTSQSGAVYASTLSYMKDTGMIPREQADSLEKVMFQRFPDSEYVRQRFDPSPVPPATPRSIQVLNKYNALIGFHIPNTPRKTDGFGTSGKGEYTIGTKVADIILDGIAGEKQQLSDIKSKYILIDFWASWCGPCCRAYPDLLKMQEKYEKVLCVYAISIDDNQRFWQDAVERLDSKHLLIHVRAIPGSEVGKALDKQYGILAIPTNFLLDEERKIVAMNLLGDELEKKLSQIMETKD